MLTSDLLAAYHATHYQVQGEDHAFTLRIGEYSPALDTLLQNSGYSCAAFVTAYNPYSQATHPECNQRAQQRLWSEMQQQAYEFLPATGIDPQGKWQGEDSLLILGIELQAARYLGQRYHQNAVLWMDCTAIPQLILLVD